MEAAKYLRRPDTPIDISQALVDADVRLIDSIIGHYNGSIPQNPLAPAALFASQLSSQVSTFFSNLNRPTTTDSNTTTNAAASTANSLSELSSPLVANTKNLLGGLGQKISSLNVWGNASLSSSSSTGNKSQSSPFLGSLSPSFVPAGDSSTAFVIDDDDDHEDGKTKDTHSISIQRTDQQRAQVHTYLIFVVINKILYSKNSNFYVFCIIGAGYA